MYIAISIYLVLAIVTYIWFSIRHYPYVIRLLASLFGFVLFPLLFIVGDLKDYKKVKGGSNG